MFWSRTPPKRCNEGGSHRYEPRYDESVASHDPMVLVLMDSRVVNAYVCDICRDCGDRIDRPKATTHR